jgi:hypothetical protein
MTKKQDIKQKPNNRKQRPNTKEQTISCFVADEEMNDIIEDGELINNMKQSVEDIKEGKIRIVG